MSGEYQHPFQNGRSLLARSFTIVNRKEFGGYENFAQKVVQNLVPTELVWVASPQVTQCLRSFREIWPLIKEETCPEVPVRTNFHLGLTRQAIGFMGCTGRCWRDPPLHSGLNIRGTNFSTLHCKFGLYFDFQLSSLNVSRAKRKPSGYKPEVPSLNNRKARCRRGVSDIRIADSRAERYRSEEQVTN